MSTLDKLDATFRTWLGASYDIDAIHLTLAVAAVVELDGDLLWALIVAGPGSGKTETVSALGTSNAHIVSSIASAGALLSGTSKGERSTDATGGLLREIGERGTLVFKDFTSVLSLAPSARPEVLGALREIYDGRWVRTIGADGGKRLEWSGRLGVIGAVTTEWDRAHAAVSSMGDRFVLLRMRTDALANGERAIANTGRESAMRDELAAAAKAVLDDINTAPSEITPLEGNALLHAANLTTWARTAVIRDKAGNVVDVHDREAPTRFAKQLFQILRGGVAVGLPRNEAMGLAIRCAQDSIPPLRLQLFRDLACHPMSYVADVRKRLQLVHNTVDRELKALQMLRLVELDENGNHWRYRLSTEVDVAVVETFPEMYVDQQSAQDPSRGRGGTYVSGNATNSVDSAADQNKKTEHQNSTRAVPDLTCAPTAHVPDFEISGDPSILEPFGPEPSDSEYEEEPLRFGSGALGEPYDSAPAGLFDGCVDDDHARLPMVSLANHPAAPSLVAAKR